MRSRLSFNIGPFRLSIPVKVLLPVLVLMFIGFVIFKIVGIV